MLWSSGGDGGLPRTSDGVGLLGPGSSNLPTPIQFCKCRHRVYLWGSDHRLSGKQRRYTCDLSCLATFSYWSVLPETLLGGLSRRACMCLLLGA